MTKYFVKSWIPAWDEDLIKEQAHNTLEEAQQHKQQNESMNPENIYEIEEIED